MKTTVSMEICIDNRKYILLYLLFLRIRSYVQFLARL